jgi:hypothetical protein
MPRRRLHRGTSTGGGFWARIYEAAPNEGLRSRREYLVWPNADADSGDEASASSNGQGEARVRDQVGTGRLAWPHPTYASHRRKLALLELTERLCVQDTPGTDLCDELDCINRAGGTIIFPTLKYLSLSSKAYWTRPAFTPFHVGPGRFRAGTHLRALPLRRPVVGEEVHDGSRRHQRGTPL